MFHAGGGHLVITLVAVICSGILCQDVAVPTELMVAGKANDPIPMEYTELMCRAHGFADAGDWLAQQQQYHGWQIKEIKCVPGKWVPTKET